MAITQHQARVYMSSGESALVHKYPYPTILLLTPGGTNARSPQTKQKSKSNEDLSGQQLERIRRWCIK